ncbi:U4/U6.U5 small nuclear ribonucleoprotein 27 kDa protein isoform X2 [Scaptodrosophila lebanonensis]|uniref:U4/U6.U5 small nuclear ribonucleoprotein 27 kDa protein n=1 Tax=Drosophila lebanonensis TaxID=7225 RepID=A0A6J2TYL3_DROLE|nr:U4/U6.U5 small nuclear ribonucleoprotein 27 kDa protein isoform X2 [Scaptodrosophila lebanonensis]
MGRSRSPVSPAHRRREKERTERKKRRERRSREREAVGATSTSRRDRERDRSRSRERDRLRGRRTRSHSRGRATSASSSGPSTSRRSTRKNTGATTERPKINEAELKGKSPEEVEMLKTMGFCTFDSTKNKKVEGNDVGEVHVILKRKYRQYMNRKGGFNRPLDFVA